MGRFYPQMAQIPQMMGEGVEGKVGHRGQWCWIDHRGDGLRDGGFGVVSVWHRNVTC